MKRTVSYRIDPPQSLPVGHILWTVTFVEFSVSSRGWLRALVHHDDERTDWYGLSRITPEWFEKLIEDAIRHLPGSKRVS